MRRLLTSLVEVDPRTDHIRASVTAGDPAECVRNAQQNNREKTLKKMKHSSVPVENPICLQS